ncbi:hypothetical protein BGZ60DRAFT_29445 [Tricladium varicosporioides]|nr:hypothetical protein BGZ60DRAFT_29445 [Hymenoscyphus varicosporioides]
MDAAKCIDETPVLQPNPDISGIGVLLGFIVTAYGTLFCCIIKAIIDHKRSKSTNNTPNLDRWAFALRATIVSFSDQQVITGISIIIGGLSQLNAGISVYHWLSVVNLAWFSTITHLITLTVLREEFQKNMPIKILRITGMAVLITMLICVMGPVGYLISDTNGVPNTFPAWCLYHPSIEWRSEKRLLGKRYNWLYQLFAIGLLIYSFLTRLVLLLSQSGGVWSFVLRIPVDQPWKYTEDTLEMLQQSMNESDGHRRFVQLAGFKFLFSIHAVFLTGNDLYQSKTWEITWLSLAIAWGTIRIDVSRSGVSSLGNPSELSQDVRLQHNI